MTTSINSYLRFEANCELPINPLDLNELGNRQTKPISCKSLKLVQAMQTNPLDGDLAAFFP